MITLRQRSGLVFLVGILLSCFLAAAYFFIEKDPESGIAHVYCPLDQVVAQQGEMPDLSSDEKVIINTIFTLAQSMNQENRSTASNKNLHQATTQHNVYHVGDYCLFGSGDGALGARVTAYAYAIDAHSPTQHVSTTVDIPLGDMRAQQPQLLHQEQDFLSALRPLGQMLIGNQKQYCMPAIDWTNPLYFLPPKQAHDATYQHVMHDAYSGSMYWNHGTSRSVVTGRMHPYQYRPEPMVDDDTYFHDFLLHYLIGDNPKETIARAALEHICLTEIVDRYYIGRPPVITLDHLDAILEACRRALQTRCVVDKDVLNKLLRNYNAYHRAGYLDFLRGFSQEYEAFMLELDAFMTKKNANKFTQIQGFEQSFGNRVKCLLGRKAEKRGRIPFRDFIRDEAARIRAEQKQRAINEAQKKSDNAEREVAESVKALLQERAAAQQFLEHQKQDVQHDSMLDADSGTDCAPEIAQPRDVKKVDDYRDHLASKQGDDRVVELAQVGLDWADMATASQNVCDTVQTRRYANRLEALVQTLENPVISNRVYTIDDVLAKYAHSGEIEVASLATLHGHQLQHALHEEALDLLRSGCVTAKECTGTFYLGNTVAAAQTFTASAFEHIKEDNVGHAGALLDLAQGLIAATKECVEVFGIACDLSVRGAHALCKIANRTKDIVRDRIPQVVKTLPELAVADVALQLLSALPYPPLRMALLATTALICSDHARTCWKKYRKLAKKNPIEANAKAAAYIIEFVVLGRLQSEAKKQLPALQRQLTRLKNIMSSEVAVGAAASALGPQMPGAEVIAHEGPIAQTLSKTQVLMNEICDLAKKDPQEGQKVIDAIKARLVAEEARFASGHKPASAPVWRKGQKVPKGVDGTNPPVNIYGREYSGHAVDRMQQRGITPSVVEAVIKIGIATQDAIPGRMKYYDSNHDITVIIDLLNGNVITTSYGKL